MQLVGTPCDGGSTYALRLVRLKIAIKEFLEMCENVFVCSLAGDELAVIKTSAVIQEQLDGRCYDGIAVPVRSVVYFGVYFFRQSTIVSRSCKERCNASLTS